MGSRHVELRDLAERIRAIEVRHEAALVSRERYVGEAPLELVGTGWDAVDAALGGGLAPGGLHEWFGVENERAGADRRWTPPLCILIHLAWQAVERQASRPWTVWVGKLCHPYPRGLVRGGGADRRLLERSLFVAPRNAGERLWAIDLALRSAAVGAVVADGSGFDRAATQRLQLLARTEGKWVLAACPSRQREELSAAQTRWRVRMAPPMSADHLGEKKLDGIHPRWIVELLRCKGVRPAESCREGVKEIATAEGAIGNGPGPVPFDPSRRAWLLEWNRAEGTVDLSAALADLAGASTRPIVSESCTG